MSDDATRSCPRCALSREVTMTHVAVKGVTLDACPACRGAWLDADEWRPLVGRDRSVTRPRSIPVGTAPPRCPACPPPLTHDGPSRRPPALVPRGLEDVDDVEVDICTRCGGAWLDAGELARLRDRIAEVEAARSAAEEAAAATTRRTKVRAAFARDEGEAMTFLEVLKDAWANLWR